MKIVRFVVKEFITDKQHNPFREWLESLAIPIKAKVQARIFRFENGNLGDVKNVGSGVWEARFNTGPGYRVYFGINEQTIIILLGGGDKKTQKKDISSAKEYWREYKESTI